MYFSFMNDLIKIYKIMANQHLTAERSLVIDESINLH